MTTLPVNFSEISIAIVSLAVVVLFSTGLTGFAIKKLIQLMLKG